MLDGLEGKILEIFLFAIMVCCILIGSNRGLIISLYSMVKYIIITAATIGIAPVVAKRMPESLVARDGIGYVIAFFICLIVFNIIGRLIRLADDLPIVDGLNKFGGAIFGLVLGFFVVWTVLAVLGVLQDYEWCKKIVESAKDDKLIMWFQNCNPIPILLKRLGFQVMS